MNLSLPSLRSAAYAIVSIPKWKKKPLTALLGLWSLVIGGQTIPPPTLDLRPDTVSSQSSLQKPEYNSFSGTVQEQEGKMYHLRGAAKVETASTILEADEIDYNTETSDASARGHVKYQNLETKELVFADRAEYNANSEEGKFYGVKGSSPSPIKARAGLLSTTNPLYFEGKWAEKRGEEFILHEGWMTNCRIPNPWWTLRGSRFRIIPGNEAIAYNAIFRLRGMPLLLTPYFYKSLSRQERKSGFLSPSFGNSNRRGQVLGLGYYWAINRSYDVLYRATYFTERGLAHNVDFRGKPNARTSFGGVIFAISDKGISNNNTTTKYGGISVNVQGRSDLGRGFYAIGQLNYLSSFNFRREFSDNFNEAIFSEVKSVGVIGKQWHEYSVHLVASQFANYQDAPTNVFNSQGVLVRPQGTLLRTSIRKLPQFELNARERQLGKKIPLWFSWSAVAGAVSRTQQEFDTRNFVDRFDVSPRVSSALHFWNINVMPSIGGHATSYGDRLTPQGKVVGENILRRALDAEIDVLFPPLERTFAKKGFWGEKLKHVIEPRATYRYVTGVDNFSNIIRFDDLDLLSNTNQVTVSVANRIFAKQKNGNTREVVTLEVSQIRFFDPTFGGIVSYGDSKTGRPVSLNARNIVLQALALTPFAYIDEPRNYSPVTSRLRVSPDGRFGVEWREDYDPRRGRIVNSSVGADARLGQMFINVSHNQIRSNPLLSPNTNQLTANIAYGRDTRKGWNVGSQFNYDLREERLLQSVGQVTYNTNCCGFSMQYRRLNFGFRSENQFRVAFVVANIGSFGTLRRQDRVY